MFAMCVCIYAVRYVCVWCDGFRFFFASAFASLLLLFFFHSFAVGSCIRKREYNTRWVCFRARTNTQMRSNQENAKRKSDVMRTTVIVFVDGRATWKSTCRMCAGESLRREVEMAVQQPANERARVTKRLSGSLRWLWGRKRRRWWWWFGEFVLDFCDLAVSAISICRAYRRFATRIRSLFVRSLSPDTSLVRSLAPSLPRSPYLSE